MRIIDILLDSLFPPRPNEIILKSVTAIPYQPNSHGGSICLSSFQEPSCSAAVTENKFHNHPKARKLLASLLEKWLNTQNETVVIIPVPLSRKRFKERGYNQVLEVAKEVKEVEIKILNHVVSRHKNTPPQTSLSKVARQKNVKGAFVVADKETLGELSDCTVVILDDVVTTGATLNAVRAALAPHLPQSTKLITLALAH